MRIINWNPHLLKGFSGTLTCHQYQIGGSPNSSTPTNQLIEWDCGASVSAEPLHCLTRHSSKHFGVAMPDTSALWGSVPFEVTSSYQFLGATAQVKTNLCLSFYLNLLYMAKFLLKMLLLHVCHWLNLLLTITLLLKGQTEHSILPTVSDPKPLAT